MVKPITPTEARGQRVTTIPEEVIEAFNELIVETGGRVLQKDAVLRITQKMHAKDPAFHWQSIYDKGWLDIEDTFRAAGWVVEYDKPGYCEDYEAYFTFRSK